MRITGVVLWLLFSGYIVSLCFRGMNMSRDDTYIGGIVALCLWFFVVTPMVLRQLVRHEKNKKEQLQKEKEDEKETGVNGKSAKSGADAGVYAKNRPGNGGN